MSDGITDTERRWWLCDKCGAGGFVDEGPIRCDDDECPITWALRWNTGAQAAGSPVSDAGTAGAAAGDEGRATQPRHCIADTERLAEIRERIARLATDPDVAPHPELTDRFLSRIIAERDAEIAQLRADLADTVTCLKNERRLYVEALTAVVEWHERKRAWHLSFAEGYGISSDFDAIDMCNSLANEHADAAAYFRSLIPQEPQGEQTPATNEKRTP